MSLPTESEINNIYNNNESAGYPEFSSVHEYPKINNPVRRVNPNKNYNYQKQQIPQKKQKNKRQPIPVPQNQLYMDSNGQKYMAVPVGSPKLVPIPVSNPYPYPNAYPNYNGAYYPQTQMYPQPYPYYPPPPPPGGNTVFVIPPGYEYDYSGGYSPFGNLMEDLDNLF